MIHRRPGIPGWTCNHTENSPSPSPFVGHLFPELNFGRLGCGHRHDNTIEPCWFQPSNAGNSLLHPSDVLGSHIGWLC